MNVNALEEESEDVTFSSSSSAWMETGGGELGDEICLGLMVSEPKAAASSESPGLVSRTHEVREQVLSSGRGLSLFRICPDRGDRLDTSIQPARRS